MSPPATPPAPFVARFSPWRRVAGLLACAGFVAAGLWIAGVIGSLDQPSPLIGGLAVVTFGGFMGVGLRRLASTGDAIRIDADGLWLWRQGGGITIPWSAVRGVTAQRVHGQSFLCLTLDAPDRYRAGWINTAFGFGDVSVGVQATDARFDDLVAAVSRYAPVLPA